MDKKRVIPGAAAILACCVIWAPPLFPAPAAGPAANAAPSPAVALPGENMLLMPPVGWQQMRILSPTLLELTLITTKASIEAPPEEWNFVDSGFKLDLPPAADFTVTVNRKPVPIAAAGFKRRPLYAPLKSRDLRIGNYIYLQLASPLPDGAAVAATVPGGRTFSGSADILRFNPAIHVNQVGYAPSLTKKAVVGYYLGSLGELPVDPGAGFKVVDAATGREVFRGDLKSRRDQGFQYAVAPYQKVYEADFSALETPGQYRVAVPGMGASLPFAIDEGLAAAFARTYALGLYHQRCGAELGLPFTRFAHKACHLAPAEIPTPAFKMVQRVLDGDTAKGDDLPPPKAPRMANLQACLYPFVKEGKVDVTRGHHDAGDYSKYTINSAALIHYLVWAADVLPGVGALDNLGLPESGDGKSDILQIVRWETEFLSKMQDSDGGFYFLVYPRDRKYEGNVTPDQGDPQVVYPKTTSVTAAGVAALAQAARSPLFRRQFPGDAARYLKQARKGWEFLERAWAKYGRQGAYQKITHYGNNFGDADEVAWAAAELYLATGEQKYHERLAGEFDPADPKTWRWGWVHLTESYGNAIRSYAFADRSAPGRRLDAAYLAKCRAEISAAGQDALSRAGACAYGTSFPLESKRFRTAGWYFPIAAALDLIAADQLEPKPGLLEAAVGNLNYEGGLNPNNVTFITGLGWRRQREIVHQFAQNDRRVLPPTGLPLGAIQKGFPFIKHYKRELGILTFPVDGDKDDPYPFYDRWGDTFNTKTEFVISNQARGLAWLAWLMARTPAGKQPWTFARARIAGIPSAAKVGEKIGLRLEVDGLDPAAARIVWEGSDQEPVIAAAYDFTPVKPGIQWIEAEAQWPDGRRAFAAAEFRADPSGGGTGGDADQRTR